MTTAEYGKAFEDGFSNTVRFLMSRGANPEIAEETAQAAWTRGWICHSQLRNPDCVGSWINSIAMNLFRNSYRTSKRNQVLSELLAGPSTTLIRVDVAKVLNYCREKDRQLLKLFYIHGYTTGEIGRRVGLTSTAVRVRLLRARRTLRERMKIHSCSAGEGNVDALETESLPQAA